ncbi:MAG: DsbE family thiol:disulfide interchange protein [Pseudomonadota bacterium]
MNWSRLLPVGLFVVLIVFLGIGLTRDPSVIPTEMIDRELPAFELPELREEGSVLTERDLKGEAALVNVFGSWCVACLQEHPTLMELSRDGIVRIVGVNWRDKREDALRWLARHGDPYDAIVFDKESDFAIEVGVTGAPETFVVDATGRIRYKQIGPITPEVWKDTIRPVLDAIALEKPVEPIFDPEQVVSSPTVTEPVTSLLSPDQVAARTDEVAKTLRCVVCQNQSIYDSNAPLAMDMRRLVRKRVAAGDSDDEVRTYLQDRYGDYVLMSPPLQLSTFLLWAGPALLLLLAGLWVLLRLRAVQSAEPETLSAEDRARVMAALASKDPHA